MNQLQRATAAKKKAIRKWEDIIRAELAKEGASLRLVAKDAGVSHERVRQIKDHR